MTRLGDAVRRRLAPTPDEREQHLEQRRALTQHIANQLGGAHLQRLDESGRMHVVLVQNDLVGPLGGLSDKISIQVGDGPYARHFIVSIYAYGQMAEAN